MDLISTPSPSVLSLLDSDLESIGSLQYLDIEELDEVEYALPASHECTPSLAEVLLSDQEEAKIVKNSNIYNAEPMCSALQADFLHGISQQMLQAQERSSAGVGTSLSVGIDGKLTIGTAHGHLLSFQDQTLRWVCNSNTDKGAVSSISYNQDGTRLLAGFARGLIVQYETKKGFILRKVNLGSEIWGTLQVTWAGTSALALDTGGSVWLIKFSRPLGVRSARSSCLFSGARGEVVAMAARDARILALATLSRVIIVAGGQAAGLRLGGQPNTLPVMAWCETNERILVCARDKVIQWLSVNITGTTISLRLVQRSELKMSPLWLGWLDGNLAILDADENLRLWGDDYDKPLDLSHIEPVYASAFFKGVWTEGKVSRAMCLAGASALSGASVCDGALSMLGRRGVVRVRPRDVLARARTLFATERYIQALRLMCLTQGKDARDLALEFLLKISERPSLLDDKHIADQVVKFCLKYNLRNEMWSTLWEHCSHKKQFVEALGDAAVRGELSTSPPSPDNTQALIEKLAEFEPSLVERVLASLPLTSLDPHRASVFTRNNRLWRGVGAIAATLGGSSGAMRTLVEHVDPSCRRAAAGVEAEAGVGCACAGGALLLAAADALAGRAAAGLPLPDHQRPSARHDALLTFLSHEAGRGGSSPLQVVCAHDARACVRLLEQCARDPPFAGPLGKQNRLRVARQLLATAKHLQDNEDRAEILDFVTAQLSSGALPIDQELMNEAQELASHTSGERSDRAWLTLLHRERRAAPAAPAAAARPRLQWRLHAAQHNLSEALTNFFLIASPSSADVDELFDFLQSEVISDPEARSLVDSHFLSLIRLRPSALAALVGDGFQDAIITALSTEPTDSLIEFAERLLDLDRLKGAAAAAYLRLLCLLRKDSVKTFLIKNAGIVRPEEALKIVRESGIVDAEPICLEAVGDPCGALDSILNLASSAADGDKFDLIKEACDLCTRIGPTVPSATIADMWSRLLRHSSGTPPSLLMEAIAYLPAEELIDNTRGDVRVALKMLECARDQQRVWSSVSRVCLREVHCALGVALRAARRALGVQGGCAACGAPLAAAPAARTSHCTRAFHAHCPAELTCGTCCRAAPRAILSLPAAPARYGRAASLLPLEHGLVLVAPPRPDLEGIA